MTTKKNNATKYKRAGIALALLTGLTFGGAVAANKANVDKDVKNMKYTVKKMNHDEKVRFLQKTDSLIVELQQKIESDQTDPEERFHSRQVLENLMRDRAALQKILDKER